MISSFVTGSQKYGEPTEASDIDVAVLLDKRDIRLLNDLVSGDDERYGDSHSLRFGRLNLILFKDQEKFEAWRRATDELEQKSIRTQVPVTRAEAVALIKHELYKAEH